MKLLLSKKYLDEFDLSICGKKIFDLFDDYNFLRNLVDNNIDIEYKSEVPSNNKVIINPELSKIIKRDTIENALNIFDKKIENLKNNMTDDEIRILNYSIIERETDAEVQARICKYSRTFYQIKKSCYVKIILKFNLLDRKVNSIIERVKIENLF